MPESGTIISSYSEKITTMSELFPSTPPRETLNILYVDDDSDDRELFAEALVRGELPHKLTDVESCNAGLQLLEEGRDFDIIFLDINLPAIDGRECLKLLKAHASFKN